MKFNSIQCTYEKTRARPQHLEIKQGRDPLVEDRLLMSHYCEDSCGKAKHNPKMFQVWYC